ncbi:MAG: ATP-binding cassette domain-containing protein [Candidatus Omnitrophica bacterium]|nr:ATP-binding cassette domain-containing protein [Candidatus Omnitrophota bacterium]
MRGTINAKDLDFVTLDLGEKLLDRISLSVKRGEKLGITGPSGSGKTTLGMHLAGVHRKGLFGKSRGSLLLGGMECIDRDLPGFSGIVLQNPAIQLFCDNVFEEISVGPGNRGLSKEEVNAISNRIVGLMGLADIKDSKIKDLSHGLKQKVSIASMIAMRPDVLLLDEPTNFLDPEAQKDMFDVLDVINRESNVTIIVIEHNKKMLSDWADRIVRMDRGRIVPGTHTHKRYPGPDRFDHKAGKEVVRFDSVGYGYGTGVFRLEGSSFTAREGEIISFIGPNGSGKTTILKLIKGVFRPDQGDILIKGRKSTGFSDDVGLVFQDPDEQLFAHTVREECGFCLEDRGFSEKGSTRQVEESLRCMGLKGKDERLPFSLSYGEKRRLAIASVLAWDPDIICLDEPTVGLDDDNLFMLRDILIKMAERGKTIFLSTHDLEFACAVSHNIIRVDRGRVDVKEEDKEVFV